VDAGLPREALVHGGQGGGGQLAGGDVGLVGHHEAEEAGLLQRAHRRRRPGERPELLQRQRRARAPAAVHRGIEHAVAVEEDGPAHRRPTGCPPAISSASRKAMRWWSTTWKPSTCGVVSKGTTTQTSHVWRMAPPSKPARPSVR